jgi:hypothetical protein
MNFTAAQIWGFQKAGFYHNFLKSSNCGQWIKRSRTQLVNIPHLNWTNVRRQLGAAVRQLISQVLGPS